MTEAAHPATGFSTARRHGDEDAGNPGIERTIARAGPAAAAILTFFRAGPRAARAAHHAPMGDQT